MINLHYSGRHGVNGFIKVWGKAFHSSKRCHDRNTIVKENDIVLLKKIRGFAPEKGAAQQFLTPPLQPGRKVHSSKHEEKLFRGSKFRGDDIIGKRIVDKLVSAKGVEFRIAKPTLGDYTSLSPRLVTPIYPSECNLIVSLLDLHPTVPGANKGDERLEIFEAGTGHGALTLHLARAIHGANTAAPDIPLYTPRKWFQSSDTEDGTLDEQNTSVDKLSGEEEPLSPEHLAEVKAKQEAFEQWRATRRAVIHTLDRSPQFSNHAKRTIKYFRQGIYYPHIDFHTGSIENYITSRLAENEDPFFDYAVLDLPSPHDYLDLVAKAMKTHGILITFSPSVTSLIECLGHAKKHNIPLWLENTIEIGAGIAVGGREWDVRSVRPRSQKVEASASEEGSEQSDGAPSEDVAESELPEAQASPDSLVSICRPKTGTKITAGAFLGVWRKMTMPD